MTLTLENSRKYVPLDSTVDPIVALVDTEFHPLILVMLWIVPIIRP